MAIESLKKLKQKYFFLYEILIIVGKLLLIRQRQMFTLAQKFYKI